MRATKAAAPQRRRIAVAATVLHSGFPSLHFWKPGRQLHEEVERTASSPASRRHFSVPGNHNATRPTPRVLDVPALPQSGSKSSLYAVTRETCVVGNFGAADGRAACPQPKLK